ncbi:hypothetical protein AAEX63_01770 [Luteococcus sp. H138]|uniref:hypothetical protein n=1 Tax=Luteococcus sp. H138 TaxID=3139404 RepID=UPI00313BBA4E
MERTPSLLDAVDLLVLGIHHRAVDDFVEVERLEPTQSHQFWHELLGDQANLPMPDRVFLVAQDAALVQRAMELSERLPIGLDVALDRVMNGRYDDADAVFRVYARIDPQGCARTLGVIVSQVAVATTGESLEHAEWTFDDAMRECRRMLRWLGAETITHALAWPNIERWAERWEAELRAGDAPSARTLELLDAALAGDPERTHMVLASCLTVTYLTRRAGDVVSVFEAPRSLSEVLVWIAARGPRGCLDAMRAWFDGDALAPGFISTAVMVVEH